MKKAPSSAIRNQQPLRALMVDDSEDDVLLTIRALKKGGYNPVYKRVETAAAMKKALKETSWDIILCDYIMPHFSAPAAIALLKETNINIPVIIISGTIGEETAIECMRLGAQDYLMKSNLSRLCPAIDRELEEAKNRKKAEEKLSQSEEKYRIILENMQEGYFEVDLAGNYTFLNDSLCRIHGYPKEELMGMNNRQYTEKEFTKKVFLAFNKVYKTGEPLKEINWQITRKDGSKRYIEASVSLRKGSLDKPVGFRGILRDITERIEIEDKLRNEEHRFRALAEQSSDIIILVNREGIITYANPTIDILGISAEKRIRANVFERVHPDDRKTVTDSFNILFNDINAPVQKAEVRVRHSDGRWFTFEVVSSNLVRNKVIEAAIVNLRDITERKKAEDALRKSERFFKEVTENSSDIIVITDENGIIKYCSPSIERFAGYKPEEVIGKNALLFIHPDEVQRAADEFGKSLIDGRKSPLPPDTFRVMHKNGSKHYFYGTGKILLDNPDIAGVVINISDITERKQAEQALSASEEKYRTLVQNIEDAIFIMKGGKIIFANERFSKMLNYSIDEVIGKSIEDIVAPEYLAMVTDRYIRRMKGEKILNEYEFQVLKKDGVTKIDVRMTVGIINYEGGLAALGTGKDITERKNAENAIRDSETKYRNIFENAMEGIYQVTIDGRFITANNAFARMAGYDSPEDLIESIKDIKSHLYVHAEDRDRFLKIMKTKGFVEGFEVEFFRKDRSVFWVVLNARAVKDEQGRILYNEGLIEDISLRKQAEEQLKQSIEKLKRAIDTTIQVLVSALETRDPYTVGHQSRSADIACAIATEMGLSQEKIDGIRMAGIIHDIGKLSIPVEILSKPSKLTNLEFSLIKEHSQSGFEMLKDIESPWPLAQIVQQHHERINGTGYPKNLKGDDILIEARILTVADVVEAMASHRPYRASLGIEKALEEIEKNKGILYDENVVKACLRLFREKGYTLE